MALTARVRKKLNVMSFEMPRHVAFVREHLLATSLRTLDRCYLRLCLMSRLLVSIQVRSVCVSFVTSFDITAKCFLKEISNLFEVD